MSCIFKCKFILHVNYDYIFVFEIEVAEFPHELAWH